MELPWAFPSLLERRSEPPTAALRVDRLPSPDVIAREIVEDLTAALAEFEAVAVALEEQWSEPPAAQP